MDIFIDVSKVYIITERLILRPWLTSDLDDFYEYASVPGVGEMAGWPHHRFKRTTRQVLQLFIEGKNVFAMELIENNKVIGSIGFHTSWANEDPDYQHLKVKDIGYTLSKDYWGQGLTPEAAKALIDWTFTNVDIDALTVCHFLDNHQSQRVIEKCGFTFVKEGTYNARQLNKVMDDAKYIMLRSELRDKI
ncbi:MAG: GNAT family N-acetyltransferase [Oscillospiraceae bacterium]|nr:GNAT family N-acetyltransferase [Oscillospiraceae bacterium]